MHPSIPTWQRTWGQPADGCDDDGSSQRVRECKLRRCRWDEWRSTGTLHYYIEMHARAINWVLNYKYTTFHIHPWIIEFYISHHSFILFFLAKWSPQIVFPSYNVTCKYLENSKHTPIAATFYSKLMYLSSRIRHLSQVICNRQFLQDKFTKKTF